MTDYRVVNVSDRQSLQRLLQAVMLAADDLGYTPDEARILAQQTVDRLDGEELLVVRR
jgi:hypothetical protein